MPIQWPIFKPSGKLTNWFETYADVTIWCFSTLVPTETDFDETRASGTSPSSTGTSQSASSLPHTLCWLWVWGVTPQDAEAFEGQANLMGKIVHSSKHGSGVDWKGKQVLIVH
jgi:putative flavoprotein involved in K+ transport